jgi:hypothetical protein
MNEVLGDWREINSNGFVVAFLPDTIQCKDIGSGRGDSLVSRHGYVLYI